MSSNLDDEAHSLSTTRFRLTNHGAPSRTPLIASAEAKTNIKVFQDCSRNSNPPWTFQIPLRIENNNRPLTSLAEIILPAQEWPNNSAAVAVASLNSN
ncbi:hypothetical protein SLE2022_178040 [Rubroshorea leprosula]